VAAGAQVAGRILEHSSDELRRIWRLARATSRTGVFPGMLDGVVSSFFAGCGRIMSSGGAPEDAWRSARGMLRISDRLGAAELTAEWAVAMEVLAAVCESFSAEPAVAEWLARAVAEAERATAGLPATGALPRGVLSVWILGDMAPPRRVSRDPVGADG
jgi:hypothetical protein